jgi:hypothetical protein
MDERVLSTVCAAIALAVKAHPIVKQLKARTTAREVMTRKKNAQHGPRSSVSEILTKSFGQSVLSAFDLNKIFLAENME